MNKITTLFILVFFQYTINAQSASQIVEISNTNLQSTARGNSVFAFTALGADFLSADLNPAGIAMFKRSEMSVTPNFSINRNNTEYIGNRVFDTNNKFNVSQFGFVFTPNNNRRELIDLEKHARNNRKNNTSQPYKSKPRKFGLNFAINFSQLNNFNNNFDYAGFNFDNSLTDRFTNRLNSNIDAINGFEAPNLFFENLVTNLAVDAGVVRSLNGGDVYVTTLQFADSTSIADIGVQQSESVISSGFYNNLTFNLAANFNDKVYVGANIGIPHSGGISKTHFYAEEDTSEMVEQFSFFDVEYLSTLNSTGLNATLGIAVKLNDNFRLGASYKTKTKNIVDYNYSASLNSNIEEAEILYDEYLPIRPIFSPQFLINSQITTPAEINVGIAYIYEKGFFSLDAEFIDFSTNEIFYETANLDSFAIAEISAYEIATNNLLLNNYNRVLNLKFGLEQVINNFRLRAGVGYFPTIYKDDRFDNTIQYGLGFGWRLKQFYVDFSGNFHKTTNFYQPYSIENQNVPSVKIINDKIAISTTLGFKF